MDKKSNVAEPSQVRRNILKGAIGAGAAALLPNSMANANDDPARMPPQVGDLLVFSGGDHKGEVITPEDLVKSENPILAFPQERETGLIRNRTRLNRIAVIQIDASRMSEEMAGRAVDGIVAFSAICTHGGCLVEMWREEALFCPCHYSRYDAWNGGKVVGGPAPRRLANLPIAMVDGQLTVAGAFDSKIGN